VILRVFFSEEPMQRLGREQWIELISEYKKSGLTQKECKRPRIDVLR
jgi:hypothetical protein